LFALLERDELSVNELQEITRMGQFAHFDASGLVAGGEPGAFAP